MTNDTPTYATPPAPFAPDRPSTAVAQPVVTGRFAPSPSGRMHLGNVYAALMAWLSVRSQHGRMVLRIEDLDARCRRGKWDGQLIEDLGWLGLDWDEGPYYQSDRIDLYDRAFDTLKTAGRLYPCFCTRAELHAASAPHASDGTPIYPGTCREMPASEVARRLGERPCAWRLRVPDARDGDGIMQFVDRVYGPHRESLADECGDFLVRRSDGVYAYQLVVCIDDADMGVTEVVRGRDLLGSSARQLYLQSLLGLPHPAYAHVPLLLSADGKCLSKRDRDCDMGELRQIFGTPERLLGHVAHLAGIAPDEAPRSAEELVDLFDWEILRARSNDIVVS